MHKELSTEKSILIWLGRKKLTRSQKTTLIMQNWTNIRKIVSITAKLNCSDWPTVALNNTTTIRTTDIKRQEDRAKLLTYEHTDLRKSVKKTGLTTLKCLSWHTEKRTRGPFLESPGNFSGPKSNIQIKIKRIRAPVLDSKLLHFFH